MADENRATATMSRDPRETDDQDLHRTLRDALERYVETGITIYETAVKPDGQLHQVVSGLIRARASMGGATNQAAAESPLAVCDLWSAPADEFFCYADPQIQQRERFLRAAQPLVTKAGHNLLRDWGEAVIPTCSKHFAQVRRGLHREIADRLGMRGIAMSATLTHIAQQPAAAYLGALPSDSGNCDRLSAGPRDGEWPNTVR